MNRDNALLSECEEKPSLVTEAIAGIAVIVFLLACFTVLHLTV